MPDQELCDVCGRPLDEDERRKKGAFWLFGSRGAGLIAAASLAVGLVLGAAAFGDSDDGPVAASSTTTPTTAAPVTSSPATTTTTTTTTTLATTTTTTTTTTTEAPIDITGTWIITVVVTEVSGSRFCELDEPYTNAVTVVQDGTSLTLVGMGNEDDPWSGTLDGATVTFGGERREDGGLTKASFEVTLDDRLTSFSGTEDWTWSDSNISCVDGKSIVTGVKEA